MDRGIVIFILVHIAVIAVWLYLAIVNIGLLVFAVIPGLYVMDKVRIKGDE